MLFGLAMWSIIQSHSRKCDPRKENCCVGCLQRDCVRIRGTSDEYECLPGTVFASKTEAAEELTTTTSSSTTPAVRVDTEAPAPSPEPVAPAPSPEPIAPAPSPDTPSARWNSTHSTSEKPAVRTGAYGIDIELVFKTKLVTSSHAKVNTITCTTVGRDDCTIKELEKPVSPGQRAHYMVSEDGLTRTEWKHSKQIEENPAFMQMLMQKFHDEEVMLESGPFAPEDFVSNTRKEAAVKRSKIYWIVGIIFSVLILFTIIAAIILRINRPKGTMDSNTSSRQSPSHSQSRNFGGRDRPKPSRASTVTDVEAPKEQWEVMDIHAIRDLSASMAPTADRAKEAESPPHDIPRRRSSRRPKSHYSAKRGY